MRCAELIWSSISQPGHRFITWMVVQDRSLKEERLRRLQIHVDNERCCLCDQLTEESSRHLFADCSWARKLRAEILQWARIHISKGDVQQTLSRIKNRHWNQFKKEIVVECRIIPHLES